MYPETSRKLLPINSSGGHVANAIVPPGFSTLSISARATSGRGAKLVTVAGEELVKDGRLVQGISDDLALVREAAMELRSVRGQTPNS